MLSIVLNLLFTIVEPLNGRRWIRRGRALQQQIDTSRIRRRAQRHQDVRPDWQRKHGSLRNGARAVTYNRHRREILSIFELIFHYRPRIR